VFSGEPTLASVIQSVADGEPMPDHVPVTVAPGPTHEGPALNVGAATVIAPLDASRWKVELANNRSSYVPGVNVVGSVTGRLPLLVPVIRHQIAGAVSAAP
jgi:hypothetical protein